MDDVTVADRPSWECVFCAHATADDPRRVTLTLTWQNADSSQQMEAHYSCLSATLRPGFPLLDPYD